jgi:hypothetical protein
LERISNRLRHGSIRQDHAPTGVTALQREAGVGTHKSAARAQRFVRRIEEYLAAYGSQGFHCRRRFGDAQHVSRSGDRFDQLAVGTHAPQVPLAQAIWPDTHVVCMPTWAVTLPQLWRTPSVAHLHPGASCMHAKHSFVIDARVSSQSGPRPQFCPKPSPS